MDLDADVDVDVNVRCTRSFCQGSEGRRKEEV